MKASFTAAIDLMGKAVALESRNCMLTNQVLTGEGSIVRLLIAELSTPWLLVP